VASPGSTSQPDGIVLALPGGHLRIQVCTPNVVRVAYAKDPVFFARSTLMTSAKRCLPTPVRMSSTGAGVTVATSDLTVGIDSVSGAVTFADASGRVLLSEKAGGRTLSEALAPGETAGSVRQEWIPNDNESLYGLGQHQHGLLDIRGVDLDLQQYNTEVFVPFLVSSAGYGILWDNTSFTRFGDLAAAVPLPDVAGLYARADASGDVDTRSGRVDWTGTVTPQVTGDYTFRTYSAGAVRLSVGESTVIDHWRQDWLPNEDVARVHLRAGEPVRIRFSWTQEGHYSTVRLLWKPPPADPTTSLWSRVGDGVDYWFVHGPALDDVVGGYRRLTGEAPMMPKWAFGLWQCKERYKTAQEVLDVLRGYRDRRIPIDNIVQDWQYWPRGQWGSHDFDPARYPDPDGWLRAIHDTYHAQLMISVWPRFYPETANYSDLRGKGFLYQPNIDDGMKDFLGHPFAVYDAFNPAAREMYWAQIDRALFARKVDAWWLDASEPEVVQGPFDSFATQRAATESHMTPTALGSGARLLNAFALVNSQAVYEGQRRTAPDQRVFILTRSGFAGQQRYAAATWSGDITATWTALKKQIPAGLGFSISGVPYWTFDTGGFVVPSRFSTATPAPGDLLEWAELNTRWFEYATFLPLLRVHGQEPAREMWKFGGESSPAYAAMLKFDRLRYRLLPYVYSLAGMVTRQGGTLLRPLVMDFREDPTARTTGDQFMFGPALLVSPVTSYMARSRSVYLPPAPLWYDFWTGAPSRGGQTVIAGAPFDSIPVYVRAGSIVPLGPELQYTSEKPADPIALYVFAGADGHFVLYEDQGTTYDYEKGALATIDLTWTDATKTLTLGARVGTFPDMLRERTFQVVMVRPGKAAGYGPTPADAVSVRYDGSAVSVPLK
jgi:alpha-D-xyloside xylohydrolase